MRRRYPVLWLMTDERIDDLASVVERLPRGAGIVFRHHHTPDAERRRLFARILGIARRRRLFLLRAGPERLPGEMGVHGRDETQRPTSAPVHSRREAIAASRAGARIAFVSPIFATRSHPGARSLGSSRAAAITRGLGLTTIALGGMDARRYRRIRQVGFDGWAAIDALAQPTQNLPTPNQPTQKRKAVPT